MATSLEEFEERIKSLSPPLSTSPSIPGVVVLASGLRSNAAHHTFSCGVATVSPNREPAPDLTPESSMWFASATKLVTSIAALQLVERGLWDLDRPVAEALIELSTLRELVSADSDHLEYAKDIDGKPAGARVTLRHLLTHTSGLAYDFLSPKLMQWWKAYSAKEGRDMHTACVGTVMKGYGGALVREPGTAWEYSPGVDWAGALVEKLHGEEQGRLGRVVQREIFDKLGVQEGEAIWRRADSKWSEEQTSQRMADLTTRTPTSLAYVGPLPPEISKDDLGGAALRTTPAAYFKVLASLLKNDGKLLKPETVETYVFTPQLGANLASSLRLALIESPAGRMMSGGLPVPVDTGADEYEYNHSLLGALSRAKGQKQWALHWGGAPNIQWFVDPSHGVAGLFSAQLLPPADPLMVDLAFEFREAALSTLGSRA